MDRLTLIANITIYMPLSRDHLPTPMAVNLSLSLPSTIPRRGAERATWCTSYSPIGQGSLPISSLKLPLIFTRNSSPISGLGESRTPGRHGASGTRSQTQLPSQPREPTRRPHSPKNPTSSPFLTVDFDELEGESLLIPKRLRKRTIPKVVESAFSRNEQVGSFRSS